MVARLKLKEIDGTGKKKFFNPSASFLTVTNLICAIGAGITACAGTRLVLQLFLAKIFGSVVCLY